MTADYDAADITDNAPKNNDSDSKLIARFRSEQDVPTSLRHLYEMAPYLRRYVYDYALLLDEPDMAAENIILRNQIVGIANLASQSPELLVRPAEKVLPPEGPTTGYSDASKFSETLEILIRHAMKKMDYEAYQEGAAQDAMTVPQVISKVIYTEDYERSPLGTPHGSTLVERQMRYKCLRKAYDDNEFGEGCSDYATMVDLSDVIRKDMIEDAQYDLMANPPAQVPVIDPDTGIESLEVDPLDPRLEATAALEQGSGLVPLKALPEQPHLMGFTLDQILMEDFRYDWSITRHDKFHECKWQAHRVWLTPKEIRTQFNIDADRIRKVTSNQHDTATGSSNYEADDGEAGRDAMPQDLEATQMGEKIAVWERWDKYAGLVYTWIDGDTEFLTVVEPPVTSRYWYPFHMVPPLNRVTGRLCGPSDVMLTMSLQDEINELHTYRRQGTRAHMPRWGVASGLIDEGELVNVAEAEPYELIPFRRPEVANGVFEFAPGAFDERLYDSSRAEVGIERMSGNPSSALGATGSANFATEEAVAAQQMNVQMKYRLKLIERHAQEIVNAVSDLIVQTYPIENVQAIAGGHAVWPELDREAAYNDLVVEITPGSTAAVDKEQMYQMAIQFGGLMQTLGLPVNPTEYTKKLLDLADFRWPIEDLVVPIGPEMMAAVMQARLLNGQANNPQVPAAGGVTGPQDDPTQEGDEGGRPAFGSQPPTQESLPGPV